MKRLIPLLFALSCFCYGQVPVYRYTIPIYTVNQSAPQPGAQLPVLALYGAQVQICATWNGSGCTSLATTYQTSAGSTACSTSTQLTPGTTSTCVAYADVTGDASIWIPAGTYAFFVTTTYGGPFGPYQFSVGGAACATGCTFTGPVHFSGTPCYDLAAVAAWSTGATDNGPTFNTFISTVPSGADICIPNGQFYNVATTLNLSGSINVHFHCWQNSFDTSVSPCGIIWTGANTGDIINATGSRGLDFENVQVKFSSASFTGTILDLSGTVGGDTTQFKVHGCHFSGPGNNTTGIGIAFNLSNNGGGSDTSSEIGWIYGNFFNNLASGINGPNGGLASKANDIHIEFNNFGGPFAGAPILAAGSKWEVGPGNNFEPVNVAKTKSQAVGFTTVGVDHTNFHDNLVGDGTVGTAGAVLIDTSLGTYANESVNISNNRINGILTLLKAGSGLVNFDIRDNNINGCTNLVDLNGNNPVGRTAPNYQNCTYTYMDSSTGNNYPGISIPGLQTIRYQNVGIGASQLYALGALFPTSLQANVYSGIYFGTYTQNPAYYQWFDGSPFPPELLAPYIDPDYGTNADTVWLHNYGYKNCTNNAGQTAWYCEYLDTSGVLHFRKQVALSSIAYTALSTGATIKGPTTGIAIGDYITDASCNGSPCVSGTAAKVSNVSGTSLTLAGNASSTSPSAGTTISLTGCTLNATTIGQSTLVGTNSLVATAETRLLISGFSGSCAPLNSANGIPSTVAFEQLSGSQFNIFTQNPGSGTYSDTGTATVVNLPSSFWQEMGSINLTNGLISAAGYQSTGTQSVAGCSLTSPLGGPTAGKFSSGTSGTCTVTITTGITAPNGWACWGSDITHAATFIQSTASTTAPAISASTTSGDVVTWACEAF